MTVTRKKKFALALATASLLVAASLGLAAPAAASPGTDHKITICHATASESNPYTTNTVDKASISNLEEFNGHGLHEGDIIPPYEAGTHKKDSWYAFPGLNWTAENQSIWENGCNASAPPEETEEPTPTPTPEPPIETEEPPVTPEPTEPPVDPTPEPTDPPVTPEPTDPPVDPTPDPPVVTPEPTYPPVVEIPAQPEPLVAEASSLAWDTPACGDTEGTLTTSTTTIITPYVWDAEAWEWVLGEAEEHTTVTVTTEPLPEEMQTECPVTSTPEPTETVTIPAVTAPDPTPVAETTDEPMLPRTGGGAELPLIGLGAGALLLIGAALLARRRSA